MPSNSLTFPLEGLEGVLESLGEQLGEAGGFRITRLDGAAAENVTAITVETTLGWATTGSLFIDGTKYAYTGLTPTTFTGLSPALVRTLRDRTSVVDGNVDFSQRDITRRMLLVNFSEAEFLDALGRNLGVDRPSGLDDTDYRKFIRVLAYLPRGTVHALEEVLDALIGSANYTIFEDLVDDKNLVVITLLETATLAIDDGKGFFTRIEDLTSDSATQVTATEDPLNVIGVFLADKEVLVDFDSVKPSGETDAWQYIGTESEATAVVLNGDGSAALTDTSGNGQTGAAYRFGVSTEKETKIMVHFRMSRASVGGSTNEALNVRIPGRDRLIILAWNNSSVYFLNGVNAPIGNSVAVDTAVHDYMIVRRGERNGQVDVELWIDGVLVRTVAYTAFGLNSTGSFTFGSFATTANFVTEWHWLRIWTHDEHHNFMNERQLADGSTSSGDPDRVNSGGSFFDISDADKMFTVEGATAAHGRGNGRYEIFGVDVPGGTYVDLVGKTYRGGEVSDQNVFQIPEDHDDIFTAEDAHIAGTLLTGSVPSDNAIQWTSRAAGDDSGNQTVEILDPGAASPLIISISGFTDITVTLAHDGTAITSTAQDVIDAFNADPDAPQSFNTENADGSDGTGLMVAFGTTAPSTGENGKDLVITGSALGNDGTYPIADLIDARTVRVGVLLPAVPDFAPESSLSWRKDPNFPTDSALDWEVFGAGSEAAGVITLRRALPTAAQLVRVEYTTVESGQILQSIEVVNDPAGTFFPMYLADPLAFVKQILDDVTVAGVIMEFKN